MMNNRKKNGKPRKELDLFAKSKDKVLTINSIEKGYKHILSAQSSYFNAVKQGRYAMTVTCSIPSNMVYVVKM